MSPQLASITPPTSTYFTSNFPILLKLTTAFTEQLHYHHTNHKPHKSITMSAPKVGDSFPKDISFPYIPASKDISDFKTCGMVQPYKASESTSSLIIYYHPSPFPYRQSNSANISKRVGRQESRPLRPPRRLHTNLLCQPRPSLHRQAGPAEGQGC